MEQLFIQTLVLLGAATATVVLFQRLSIPSSLAYLLVGVVLGPHTGGPAMDDLPIQALAEFGIVFLLFTIGLSFSIPQLHAMRHTVLGLGTAQVVLTTAIVMGLAWLIGLPPVAAFVVGAVFAQSSTTIISKQLFDQDEERSRHGRSGIAISVFQDVTAVPFVIIIPVLGMATMDAIALTLELGRALFNAGLAVVLVFLIGRWVLPSLFHLVARRRSAEAFTLTVLLVSLLAAGTTETLGLSMAFGGFLAGMMLGETEFRHQVESTIRPFRDVLLGLFFIGIGMLFDPAALPGIWHWALLGTLVLVLVKAAVVAAVVHIKGMDTRSAWRTGWLLAVGGEFGLALSAVALNAGTIDTELSQILLSSVLFSMIAAPFIIRYNNTLAYWMSPRPEIAHLEEPTRARDAQPGAELTNHVIICGYGRIGQSVARFLEMEGYPYVALDTDPYRVREAYTAGERVFYGDAAEPDVLDAMGMRTACLLVISHDDVNSALKVLANVRQARPDLPVMVRTRDETHVEDLRKAGATEVVPETLEASLMIAAHTLALLGVPFGRVDEYIEQQRNERYPLLREFPGQEEWVSRRTTDLETDRLRAVELPPGCDAINRSISEMDLKDVAIATLVREGKRRLSPAPDTALREGDVLVLFGAPEALRRAEDRILKYPG